MDGVAEVVGREMAVVQQALPTLTRGHAPAREVLVALRRERQAVRASAQRLTATERLAFARCFVAAALSSYWRAIQRGDAPFLPVADLPADASLPVLTLEQQSAAFAIGALVARLDPVEAGYQIGEVYTASLPADLRARHGIYYTPPPLTRRLLNLAEGAGTDWATCRVLDPACGGGAFLTPVALAMAGALAGREPAAVFEHICARLQGLEIDPVSAWLSQVLLEAALLPLCRAVGRRLPALVTVCDSLTQEPDGAGFDLVIGNPPYGRVTLAPEVRARYRRSLYGHANLYGVFTDLAVRWTRPGGVIAYVTPTSFLGGEYFKALRRLLAAEAPPAAIDLITARKGVFADVLQETLLATYRRAGRPIAAPVHVVTAGEQEASASPAGSFVLPENGAGPWLLPRAPEQVALIARLRLMPHRLRDYGYTVSTGPLVWNRHKPQLRAERGRGAFPLIWAEAITTDGCFAFRSGKKNHQPYFQPRPGDDWLITTIPCVLVQRTTAKEQRRRLIAAELPGEFIRKHGAVVVENHLNMVRPRDTHTTFAPAVLAALLNSAIVDEAFRCISGSVAVSAFELEALPLPAPADLARLETLVRDAASREALSCAIREMYLGEEAS